MTKLFRLIFRCFVNPGFHHTEISFRKNFICLADLFTDRSMKVLALCFPVGYNKLCLRVSLHLDEAKSPLTFWMHITHLAHLDCESWSTCLMRAKACSCNFRQKILDLGLFFSQYFVSLMIKKVLLTGFNCSWHCSNIGGTHSCLRYLYLWQKSVRNVPDVFDCTVPHLNPSKCLGSDLVGF